MRHEKAAQLLKLARALAGSAEGLSLDEMGRRVGVDRRTAERMRDALRDLFPQIEDIPDGKSKRFRISGGLDGFLQQPTAEELAELQASIRSLENAGSSARADLLRSLEAKINAALRPQIRRRIAPDVEALVRAERLVMEAGPKPIIETQTLAMIREAIKGLQFCCFHYRSSASRPRRKRTIIPYGLLFGRDYYLVGPERDHQQPVLWRLDRIEHLALGGPCKGAPENFDLGAFAAQSFGTFQEPPQDVVLRFSAAMSDDAKRYQFHPSQTMEVQPDGSLVVRFRAGGFLEMVWHLFSWGAEVEILAPQLLKDMMIEQLDMAIAAHGGA